MKALSWHVLPKWRRRAQSLSPPPTTSAVIASFDEPKKMVYVLYPVAYKHREIIYQRFLSGDFQGIAEQDHGLAVFFQLPRAKRAAWCKTDNCLILQMEVPEKAIMANGRGDCILKSGFLVHAAIPSIIPSWTLTVKSVQDPDCV